LHQGFFLGTLGSRTEAFIELCRYDLLHGLRYVLDHTVCFGSRVVVEALDKLFLALGAHFSNNAVSLLLQSGDRFGISKGTLARLASLELQAHIR
jgi:hypothetical protein